MKVRELILALAVTLSAVLPATGRAESGLRNERYTLELAADGAISVQVAGMPSQRLVPEFTVLWSESDPQCRRNASHPNYAVAPRVAVRWQNPGEPVESLNAWLSSPEFRVATGWSGAVQADGPGRAWEFRDGVGTVKMRVTGRHALDTTRPFTVGRRVAMSPVRAEAGTDRICWEYEPREEFEFRARLELPPKQDPLLTFTITPKRDAFFSVAFTGAPETPLRETLPVPQECDARGHRQFDFVMSEADLHLPRAHVATASGNLALAADPGECRFRLPAISDSRFGFLLATEGGKLKPVLLAPLLGGAESKMRQGVPWSFTFCFVLRAGNWKETYAHIARDIHGFRDQRDNSGPGSLNGTLERVLDFLADRRGGNRALWDPQQKYYDYFTDKTGVFKPFSPLYGLGAAVVTDDEELFLTRARPAVEYALSRKNNLFAPYDAADNRQARSAGRELGAPYLSREQLLSLDEVFQGRSPVLRALAEASPPARKSAGFGEEAFFNLLDRACATRDPRDIGAAREAAYHNAAKLNLYPVPPEQDIAVDPGGLVPVHAHSFGRHRNQWGFPPPQPLRVNEQTVPAWRIARLGLPGIAYPIEYWMNTHGALMRTAALAQDDFLRDLARWGMVGRFGNFPGDNRSQPSLVPELPDAVEAPPWKWNFATVNAGHAWDFAGAVLDFLVSDAVERSRGAIDFPALSAAGSQFRVRIYGGKPGCFYGDEDVRLWLPSGLVTSDNRQLDWLAAYGNGQFYLALWNQSFREEKATILLDESLVSCDQDGEARVWRDNRPVSPVRVRGNRLEVTVSSKGILAFAIPAEVRPRLQAKLFDESSLPLPGASFAKVQAPFGEVHAALLRAGRDLTSAFVYTDALPENVIAARLLWRQGDGDWRESTDEIYPYEFSPELSDDAGAFACVFEVEDARQCIHRSPVMSLGLRDREAAAIGDLPEVPSKTEPDSSAAQAPGQDEALPFPVSDEFVSYLQAAANGHEFGLRRDGRFYPYSTQQGRRIAWRQPVWDKRLHEEGCSREEADRRFRAGLARTLAGLTSALAARQPRCDFDCLDKRQQETLLDFAHTEGAAALRPELVAAVLARDWERLAGQHLYVRYAGHVPDHPRNKAFAQRWNIP